MRRNTETHKKYIRVVITVAKKRVLTSIFAAILPRKDNKRKIHLLRGENKIAFILPPLIICYDDAFPFFYGFNSCQYRISPERILLLALFFISFLLFLARHTSRAIFL